MDHKLGEQTETLSRIIGAASSVSYSKRDVAAIVERKVDLPPECTSMDDVFDFVARGRDATTTRKLNDLRAQLHGRVAWGKPLSDLPDLVTELFQAVELAMMWGRPAVTPDARSELRLNMTAEALFLATDGDFSLHPDSGSERSERGTSRAHEQVQRLWI